MTLNGLMRSAANGAALTPVDFLDWTAATYPTTVAIIHGQQRWTYAEMRAAYEKQTGYKLRNMEFFELFAAFRLAVINVLAMKHFPAEVLELYGPVLRRGPEICLERARVLGAPVP